MIKAVLKYGLIILILFSVKVRAQQYTEYDLKAAYIYNFSKFVTWPPNTFRNQTSKFKIVILGESPITSILNKALKNRKIMGREISIQVIYQVDDLKDAQILFVSKEMQNNLQSISDICLNQPILLIGDVIEGFCQAGGVINFTEKSSKYRFEINNQVAQSSHLKISSKLLALARIVSSEEIKF